MELIEDNQDNLTIKLDWKRDLDVIYAVLMSASSQSCITNKKVSSPIPKKLDMVRNLAAQKNFKTP